MTNQEDFIVQEPYQPTAEEKKAITELEGKGLVACNWGSRKKYIKSFKDHLKQDMYYKQNKRCAFCRMQASIASGAMHCEHIVYKNKHPQWIFHPENLCLACLTCNSCKGTTEVLADPKTSTYPTASEGFKIIHPLYDKYSEHIELLGGVLYKGKTAKGIFTINTCHLYRVELAEERVDQKWCAENKGSIIAELVHLTIQPNQYVNDVNRFTKHVKSIVKEYKKGRCL